MAEVPPLVGVLFKSNCMHNLSEQLPAFMPDSLLGVGVLLCCFTVVIGMGNLTNRVDRPTHVEGLSGSAVGQGQIHCSTSAVRRGHGWI